MLASLSPVDTSLAPPGLEGRYVLGALFAQSNGVAKLVPESAFSAAKALKRTGPSLLVCLVCATELMG
jgi:hypothetical protein